MANSRTKSVFHQDEIEWSDLNSDVVELIFSKLPEGAIFRAASVCKRWYSVTETPTFAEFYRKNRNANSCNKFVHNDVTYEFTEHFDDGQREVFQIQPVKKTRNFSRVSCLEPGGEIVRTVEAAGGLHVTLAGVRQTSLLYKLSLFEKKWRTTSKMPYFVQDPIVGVVKNHVSGGHKIVVAGGMPIDVVDGKDLVVSIYDDQTDAWTLSEPLSCQFRGCVSSLFMAAVVHRNRFYVYDMYSGLGCWLDLNSNRWSEVVDLRPPVQVSKISLVSQSGELRLVAVREDSESDSSFAIWNIENEFEETMRVGRILCSNRLRNSCGAPSPTTIMAAWATSTIDISAKVFGFLIFLLAHFVITYYLAATRAVCSLHILIRSTASVIKKQQSRMWFSWQGSVRKKFLGGTL